MANEVLQAVANYGFSIVMCLILCYYVMVRDKAHEKEITDINKRHENEMAKITEAVNNNTVAIEKLCFLLSKGGEEE